MTIGEYIALRQPNIFRKLTRLAGYEVLQKTQQLESLEEIDVIMRGIPGFWRDTRW